MGYTNYYRVPIIMDKEKFKTLSEELHTISGLLPHSKSAGCNSKEVIILCGGDGTGNPEFTEDTICFNGDESKGLSHETFGFDRNNTRRATIVGSRNGLVFDFCKTARKPYNLMVQLSMLRLKHHFPECEISSDGNYEDWKQARALYKRFFKINAPKLDKG